MSKYRLRILFAFLLIILDSDVSGQDTAYTPLSFSLKSSSSFFAPDFFKPELRKSADSALVITAAVLNSQEFRDSISRYSFTCLNYFKKCRQKCTSCEDPIPAKVIFDSLYKLKRDSLSLNLLNDGECKGGSFGYSYEDDFTITSHYITIDCDDPLSFAYKYAYHLCHEYMHIVGFYHYLKPNRRIRDKDISEKTGWIAYYILKRWHNEGIIIPGLDLVK